METIWKVVEVLAIEVGNLLLQFILYRSARNAERWIRRFHLGLVIVSTILFIGSVVLSVVILWKLFFVK